MQVESLKLRLLAHDSDDVSVLSALLQDAIIPGSDMSFDRKLNEFVIIANRFCWELEPLFDVKSSDGKPIYERRLCGIRIAMSGLCSIVTGLKRVNMGYLTCLRLAL